MTTLGTPNVGLGVVDLPGDVWRDIATCHIPGGMVTVAVPMGAVIVGPGPNARVVVFTTYGDGTTVVERWFDGVTNESMVTAIHAMAIVAHGAILGGDTTE